MATPQIVAVSRSHRQRSSSSTTNKQILEESVRYQNQNHKVHCCNQKQSFCCCFSLPSPDKVSPVNRPKQNNTVYLNKRQNNIEGQKENLKSIHKEKEANESRRTTMDIDKNGSLGNKVSWGFVLLFCCLLLLVVVLYGGGDLMKGVTKNDEFREKKCK